MRKTFLWLVFCVAALPFCPLSKAQARAAIHVPATTHKRTKPAISLRTPLGSKKPKIVYNIRNYGAKGDYKTVSDGAMTAGSTALTSGSAAFGPGDVGKEVIVVGAQTGGIALLSTITARVSPTKVTLANAAGASVFRASVRYATDDTAAINRAILACHNAGGGTVFLPATSGGYAISQTGGNTTTGGIILRSGVNLTGSNTCLNLFRPGGTTFVYAHGRIGTPATLTATTSATDTTLAVSSTAQFSVGQTVHIKLGVSVPDMVAVAWSTFAKVAAIPDSSHLTIDRPVGYALSSLVVNNSDQKSVAPVTEMLENQTISGLHFYNPALQIEAGGFHMQVDGGISLCYARSVSLKDLIGENVGAGLVCLQYDDNIHITNTTLIQCAQTNGQLSLGNMFAFSNCRNVTVDGARAENFQAHFAVAEQELEGVHYRNLKVTNNWPGRSPYIGIFSVIGNAHIDVDNLTLDGNGSVVTTYVDATGRASFHNTTLDTATQPILAPVSDMEGELSVQGTHYKEVRSWSSTATILPSQGTGQIIRLPHGIGRRLRVFVSSKTGLTSLALGGKLTSTNVAPELTAGATTDLSHYCVFSTSGYSLNTDLTGNYVGLYTDGSVPPEATVTIYYEYYAVPGDDGSQKQTTATLKEPGSRLDMSKQLQGGRR